MSLEKVWDPFLEDFLQKMASRLVSSFRKVSFLHAKISAWTDKRIDGNLQEVVKFEEEWIIANPI